LRTLVASGDVTRAEPVRESEVTFAVVLATMNCEISAAIRHNDRVQDMAGTQPRAASAMRSRDYVTNVMNNY